MPFDAPPTLSGGRLLGTFLARAYWGGAANAEFKALMVGHTFRFVERVVFIVGPENRRLQRALEKIGAVRVGNRPDGAGRPSLLHELRRPSVGRAGLTAEAPDPPRVCGSWSCGA